MPSAVSRLLLLLCELVQAIAWPTAAFGLVAGLELGDDAFECGNHFAAIDFRLLELELEIKRLCGRAVLKHEGFRPTKPGL